jgi:hypothetical protein
MGMSVERAAIHRGRVDLVTDRLPQGAFSAPRRVDGFYLRSLKVQRRELEQAASLDVFYADLSYHQTVAG